MGRKGYGDDLKARARAMWLVGGYTDKEIADRIGVARPKTIGEWRRDENWQAEKEATKEAVDRKVNNAVSETISEMNQRHLAEFTLLQQKGVNALRVLDPTRAGEALAMIEVGVKGERMIRGEGEEVRAMRMIMENNVQLARDMVRLVIGIVFSVVKDRELLHEIRMRVNNEIPQLGASDDEGD